MKYFDLSVIPDYRTVFDKMWAMQVYELRLRNVDRIGYLRFGYYPEPGAEAAFRPYNDLEHIANGLYFLFNCEMNLSWYVKVNWHREMQAFLIHELGEVEIGDVPDNGTMNQSLKDAEEHEAFEQFNKNVVDPINRSKLLNVFEQFQARIPFAYAADKLAFIIGQANLVKLGLFGDMAGPMMKGDLSKLDIESVNATWSTNPIDNVVHRFVEQTRDHFYQPIYLAFIEAIYRDIYPNDPYFGSPPSTILSQYPEQLP